MTNEERIKRLERMVKTLTDTLVRVTRVINTGDYEHGIGDVEDALYEVEEYRRPQESSLPQICVIGDDEE